MASGARAQTTRRIDEFSFQGDGPFPLARGLIIGLDDLSCPVHLFRCRREDFVDRADLRRMNAEFGPEPELP
jgi:hypothetical protein